MHLRPVFCLVMFFLLDAALTIAQDRSFGTLPLVQNSTSRMADQTKIVGTTEYYKALDVFQKLVQARGDFRLPVPKFSLLNSDYRVAFIDYDKLEIVLEKKAYSVCEAFGDKKEAAIAFLLGHELTHYYEKHAWRREFIYDFKDLPIGIELAGLHDDVIHETEADYLGGFLAYSAGYGLFDKASELIQKLYAAYKLPDTIKGYPTLQDRKILSQRSAEKLTYLVDLFEMANYLNALGYYEESLQYYAYVLQQYSSRELYNNLGVTALMCALKLFAPDELKYRFFTELDLESTARGSGDSLVRKKYLHQAILQFDAAISLDPDYAPAYFNKAVAYALLNDLKRSRFYAESEAQLRSTSGTFQKTAIDAEILIALLDAIEGNTENARQNLTRLAANGHIMAKINLDILNGDTTTDAKSKTPQKFKNVKSPASLNEISKALELGDELPVDTIITTKLDKNLNYHQNNPLKPGLQFKISENISANRQIVFMSYKDIDPNPSDQVLLTGTTREKIMSTYGSPYNIVETPNGQLFVYQNTEKSGGSSGMILEFNLSQKLVKTQYFKEILN